MKDYYATLGVPHNAASEQIAKIYRKLAPIYHPDTTLLDKQHANEKIKELNEAYHVLSDPVKRAEYDRQREAYAGIGRKAILPIPEVSPANLNFGCMYPGESKTQSFQVGNSGGPITEINFTYSEDDSWFSISNIVQSSETEPFMLKVAVISDVRTLTSGDYGGWIEINCDGVTARVNLAIQMKEIVASGAPVKHRAPVQFPKWAIVFGTLVVLCITGMLFLSVIATQRTAPLMSTLPSKPASLPPGRIVFSANQDGAPTLKIAEADGTGTTDLNISGESPTWSPDGRQIVFVSKRSGESQLYLVDATGGSLTQLTGMVGTKSSPAWSPNGTQIAFIAGESDKGILFTVGLQGTREKALSNLDVGSVAHLAWSPNGQQLLFDAWKDEERRVHRIEADGTGLRQLTDFDSWQPAWSWDGERIIVASERGIYVLDNSGMNRLRLTTFRAWAPRWSPSENRIAFLSDRGIEGQLPELWVMDADGSNQARLTASGSLGYFWSPTGEWLTYLAGGGETLDESPTLRAWIMNVVTLEQQEIAQPSEVYLSWKP